MIFITKLLAYLLATASAVALAAFRAVPAEHASVSVDRTTCGRPFAASWHDHQRAPGWIVTAGGLVRLQQAGLPSSLLRRTFNRPSTLLLVQHGIPVGLAPRATLTFDYTSAAAMESALRNHQVPGSVRFLLLDFERWPLTPGPEQSHWADYLKGALSAAHADHKCVVFTPAVDLLGWLPARIGPSARFADFSQRIAVPGGALSDAFDVQSQQTEGTAFAPTFGPSVVAAVRSVRPSEPVFVGLSTNPDGRRVTPADLLTLYRAGAATGATGYWLNIPIAGAECPRCGQPQPQVAVRFLETLASSHWR
jgi:hypothetical protein